MSINTQSNSFIRVYNAEARMLKYLCTVDVERVEINVDIVSHKTSKITCLFNEKINQNYFGMLFLNNKVFYFKIVSLENSNDEKLILAVAINIDMLDLETLAPGGGSSTYKEGYYNLDNLISVFNSDIDLYTRPYAFPLAQIPYIFTGGTKKITCYFGQERHKKHADILRTALITDNVFYNFEMKQMSDAEYIEASGYQLVCHLEERTKQTISLSLFDTNVFIDYQVKFNNMEYNAIILGVVDSEILFGYVNEDGVVKYSDPHALDPNWLSDAIKPLIVKRKALQLSTQGASGAEAINQDLREQYWNNEITATMNLNTNKIDLSNLDNLFSYFIDLRLDDKKIKTKITGYTYRNGDTIEITFGNARTKLTDKLRKAGAI